MESDERTSGATGAWTEEQLSAITVGEVARSAGQIHLAPYDPAWPSQFAAVAGRIRSALGGRALRIEHTGSTSVPGLAAKPIIDVTLVVADTRLEDWYVPDLQAARFVLRIREPDWYEHRMFRGVDPAVNLHVFSAGCEEVERMVAFRDRLRSDDSARRRYERTKRELAAREWDFVQNYADAKSEVIRAILAWPEGNTQTGERE